MSHVSQSNTHTLIPSPITGHEVAIAMLPILKITVGTVIESSVEIQVCEDIVHDLPQVMVPELIVFIHPSRHNRVFGSKALVSSCP